jgi:hypothetical protein
MNPDPASNPLVVRRPGDELTEPEIKQAWQAIQQNPSALAAAEAELQQDEALRALLRQEITPPPGLLAQLQDIPLIPLAELPPANVTALPRRNFLRWVTAAAALAVGGYFWKRYHPPQQIVFTHWKDQAAAWGENHHLDVYNENLPQLQTWLKQRKAIVPNDIPKALAAVPTIGCQVINVDSGQVSVVCFNHQGFNFHLFATDQDLVVGASDFLIPGTPKIWQEQGWSFASWRTEPQALMIITQAPTDELRKLFA